MPDVSHDHIEIRQGERVSPCATCGEINAAELFGELIGRYSDRWPDICAAAGLPEALFSFTSLIAVLDTLVEKAKASA